MLPSFLYFLEFGLSESRNGILGPSLNYASFKTSLDAQNIYSELTEDIIRCPKRSKRRGSAYTYKNLKGKE